MNKSSILLLIGLILSNFLLYEFEIADAFYPRGFKIQLTPLVAFAGKFSENNHLSSAGIGYLIYCIYLCSIFRVASNSSAGIFYLAMALSIFAVIFEFYSWTMAISGNYSGQYLRIGLVLYFLCMLVNRKLKMKREPSLMHKTNKAHD